jgi:DNA-binding response OmpR family regulator
MKAKVLWIESNRAAGPGFIPKLQQKGFDVVTVPTGKAALSRINVFDPDLVVVNAVSMRTSGMRICQSVSNSVDGLPIILITDSPSDPSKEICANVVLKLPFTIRKLINRIGPLLPGGSDRIMEAGPIKLDLERRQVQCEDRESHLTPRLTRLLRMLMEHPGDVLERKQLFRRVWKTEYIGDTRTLDVHISWLRGAIERDPRHPRYLKTIRGVGYRLDFD